MAIKDRTNEFHSVVDKLKTKNETKLPLTPKKNVGNTEFSRMAADIGKKTYETTQKLQELTKLASNQSLFEDKESDIQQLTAEIKDDLKNINSQINVLQEFKKHQKNVGAVKHSETVIGTLKGKLSKTTKKFQTILKTRTENLRLQQERRQKFTGNATSFISREIRQRNTPLTSINISVDSPLYDSNNPMYDSGSGDVAIAMPDQDQQLIQQDNYIDSRLDAVNDITKIITDLQSIFGQVAGLISEQGESIERITTNLDQTDNSMSRATSALTQQLAKVSSNRWLIIKLFGVLMFFIIIFVVFFA